MGVRYLPPNIILPTSTVPLVKIYREVPLICAASWNHTSCAVKFDPRDDDVNSNIQLLAEAVLAPTQPLTCGVKQYPHLNLFLRIADAPDTYGAVDFLSLLVSHLGILGAVAYQITSSD